MLLISTLEQHNSRASLWLSVAQAVPQQGSSRALFAFQSSSRFPVNKESNNNLCYNVLRYIRFLLLHNEYSRRVYLFYVQLMLKIKLLISVIESVIEIVLKYHEYLIKFKYNLLRC